MGLNVTLYDQSGTQISSSLLTGTSIRMDGVEYFADSEGVFRIKLAGKVSNLNKDLYLSSSSLILGIQYLVLIISVFMIAFSKNSQGLHDKIVNTEVVVVDTVKEDVLCESGN